jgi:hypothetical protein|tara:strand:- start:149 stop:1132 length:984 start_codon:yes stop_codon:yes gene_type:complete
MNRHAKILGVILLSLLIAYSLFGLNKPTVIFWAIALCVGYGLLFVSVRKWRKRKIRKYHRKHKTIPSTYEDLEKRLESSFSIIPNLKKKLILPNVTLLSATSYKIEETQMAMRISLHNIEFGSVKLLCSSTPQKKYSDTEYISIPPIKRGMYQKGLHTVDDYSRIIFQDLHKYFNTPYCLIMQADGFVVNANLWREEFLDFDYIGAPWPNKVLINPNFIINMKENCVGNGGFSLRSRKLAETTAKINFNSLKFPIKNEDLVICHYLYKEMIDKGIRFASPKLAAQFSIEDDQHLYGQDVNSVFGFHAKHLKDYFLKEYMRRAPIGEW